MSKPKYTLNRKEAVRQGYHTPADAVRAGKRVWRWMRSHDPTKVKPPRHISMKGKLIIVERGKEDEGSPQANN